MRRASHFLFVNPIHRDAKSQMREGRKTTSLRITPRAKPAETHTTRISARNDTASRVVPSSRARHFRQSLTSLRLKNFSLSTRIKARARFESAPVRPTRDRAIRLLCASSRERKKKGNDDDVFKNKRAYLERHGLIFLVWFCVVLCAKNVSSLLWPFLGRKRL